MSYFLPKIDTQNNWEFSFYPCLTNRNKIEAFRELRKLPNCGVYGVFHGVGFHPNKCLYIGASTKLRSRASRFVSTKGRMNNFYLEAIIDKIRSNKKDTVRVDFFFVTDRKNLPFYEEYFIEKYRPMCNVTSNYNNKAIDTHNNI